MDIKYKILFSRVAILLYMVQSLTDESLISFILYLCSKNNMGTIYKITNLVNNKFYIGSSVNFNSRKKTHLSKLKHNKHDNKHLQNAYNKYGALSFCFDILEDGIAIDLLEDRESFYISTLKPQYNKSIITSNPCRGVKLSDEHKRKISIANTGKKRVFKNGGKKYVSKETVDKIRASLLKNRDKISNNTKMHWENLSEEDRILRNKHKIGRVFSEETKNKLKVKRNSRKITEETKAKIKNGLLKYWENKRNVL